jgi:hypothetical protein
MGSGFQGLGGTAREDIVYDIWLEQARLAIGAEMS